MLPKDKLPGDAVTDEPVLVPVPERATVSGVELAELVMLQVAVRAPVVAGLKSMEAVQWAEAAREEAQVVEETPKSAALVPVIPAALRVTELDVPLVTVTV